MKTGSDNFRQSAILDIIESLKNEGIRLMIYEPTLKDGVYSDVSVQNDLDVFCIESTVIVANRSGKALAGIANKVITRDLFGQDNICVEYICRLESTCFALL